MTHSQKCKTLVGTSSSSNEPYLHPSSNQVILYDEQAAHLVLYRPQSNELTLWQSNQPVLCTRDRNYYTTTTSHVDPYSRMSRTPTEYNKPLWNPLLRFFTPNSPNDHTLASNNESHHNTDIIDSHTNTPTVCPYCQRSIYSIPRIPNPEMRRDYFALLDRINTFDRLQMQNNNIPQTINNDNGGQEMQTNSQMKKNGSNNNNNNNNSNNNDNNNDQIMTDRDHRNNSSSLHNSYTSMTMDTPTEQKNEDSVSMNAMNCGYYARFFKVIKKLGSGSYGSVFLCHHVLDNVLLGQFAVKIIPVGDHRTRLMDILREVRTLQRLHHRNVIEYKHSWLEMYQPAINGPQVPCLFVLMEYADLGNVMDYITPEPQTSDEDLNQTEQVLRRRRQRAKVDVKQEPMEYPPISSDAFTDKHIDNKHRMRLDDYAKRRWLSEHEAWIIMFETCMGLYHLHSHGIVHRDLKPGNLLMCSLMTPDTITFNDQNLYCSNYRVLISDLGQSDFLDATDRRPRTGETGTLGFAAPELFEQGSDGLNVEWNEQVDIWSLGHILYFLAFSAWPYENVCSREEDLYRRIKNGLRLVIPRNHGRSPAMIEMIKKLTKTDSHTRPTLHSIIFQISKVLQFIQFVDWDSALRVPSDNKHTSINNNNHNGKSTEINTEDIPDKFEGLERLNNNRKNDDNDIGMMSAYLTMASHSRALIAPKERFALPPPISNIGREENSSCTTFSNYNKEGEMELDEGQEQMGEVTLTKSISAYRLSPTTQTRKYRGNEDEDEDEDEDVTMTSETNENELSSMRGDDNFEDSTQNYFRAPPLLF